MNSFNFKLTSIFIFSAILFFPFTTAAKTLFAVSEYHRILAYDVDIITDGENAINVLGQTNFTTKTRGTSQSKFTFPFGLALKP